ncbi:DNA repair and recombination protein RAD54B [Grifola frondosa]|uniref:DNA repair and recombination protein RAD54B n=1 Tax=Grifola frondosa TaxID=5627 RepID=A0A1C7LMW7_GRIFR|nr:DNA repair and recombination protein RAD54B [Grifola frondosa]
MPAFQALSSHGGQKRKSDQHDPNFAARKRQAVDGDADSNRCSMEGEQYWMVQWRNPQYRKHKTWDGDAVLVVSGNKCTLYETDSRMLTSGKPQGIEHVHKIVEGATSRALETDKKGVQLEPVNLISESPDKPSSKANMQDSFWMANWRKPQQKKHKTWDGDAFVIHRSDKLMLISESGVIVGTKKWDGLPLYSGYKIFISGREVELDSQISESEVPTITGTSAEPEVDPEFGSPPPSQMTSSFLLQTRRDSAALDSPSLRENSSSAVNSPASVTKPISTSTFYGKPPPPKKPKGPLHDPNTLDAVVMKAPTKEHMIRFNKKDLTVVPVVIDPVLARHLRPHQIEGVKFMYECVMGLRKHEGQGCILADEMGMGKTLQTISLVWTLLKQNPYTGIGPVVGKVLIVCPVSLINNWKSEFHKWLGKDRVGIFVGDKDKAVIKQFLNSRIHQVLIIGYERLRTVISELAYCSPPIGLIICDEGHRLKSANNKTSTMFEALRTPRRIILSGTPIQNELSEFHAMADFCNPGLLDDYSTFRKVYETPILKSRAPGCTAKEAELGIARSNQLTTISRSFVLRREAGILKKYLPPKHEYVVFVTPTKLQLSIFNKILSADKLDNLVRDSTAESLALINILTKISNSPILLKATADQAKLKANKTGDVVKRNAIQEALTLLPERAKVEDVSLSGKLAALANLLRALFKHTDEKCIIVSHYTSTLNIIEAFCKKKSYTYHRLDGQTATSKRQEYVNDFNKSSQSKRFIFLLSSKAGGVGLNLIGASRLCLIDSDWNPSHDLQSMARIHRDGQNVLYSFIVSLLRAPSTRQVTKIGLSDSLMGNGTSDSKSDSFTRKDLRDIFTIHPETSCHTHDLLECPCEASANAESADGFDTSKTVVRAKDEDSDEEAEEEKPKGFVVASQVTSEVIEKADRAYMKQKKAQLAALGEWKHINCLKPGAADVVHDAILSHLIYTPEAKTKKDVPAGPRSLVDALDDLENLFAPALTRNDVPGGSVSFLFERGSNTPSDGGDENGADED